MSRLKFNYDEMKKATPILDDTRSDLVTLSNRLNNLHVTDYSIREKIRDSANKLSINAENITTILDDIEKINRILNDLIDEYSAEANTLPNYIIEKRDSVINLK